MCVSSRSGLGKRVIIVVDGAAYEVVAEGIATTKFMLPLAISPSAIPVQPTSILTAQATRVPVGSLHPQTTPAKTSPPCLGGLLPLSRIGLWVLIWRGISPELDLLLHPLKSYHLRTGATPVRGW